MNENRLDDSVFVKSTNTQSNQHTLNVVTLQNITLINTNKQVDDENRGRINKTTINAFKTIEITGQYH